MKKTIVICPICRKKVNLPEGKKVRYTCPDCGSENLFDDLSMTKTATVAENHFESWISNGVLTVLQWLLILPIVLIIHKLIPNPQWPLGFDRMLIGLGSVFIVSFLIYFFKKTVFIILAAISIYLSYGTYTGSYGFGDAVKDYKAMILALVDKKFQPNIIPSKDVWFPEASSMKKAIDWDNPVVRNFAVGSTAKHFKEIAQSSRNRELIQCLAVFKEINTNWNYVNDPKSREYFAKASESVMHLSGDCDDHSILMTASLKAIGGTTRIIRTNGHVYPELYVGKKQDLEIVNYYIKSELFPIESIYSQINYHIDGHGGYWLNLDFTENFPGGKFMDEGILGILVIE